ncbi:hypothetical protein CO151_08935 [bacterium CG_4_9_14_3_um_filter_65_15]|nr:MAG: hypothetical protein CO151_08935 [bacterium CG_4_9_14_3_um_filter_65_15]
MVSHNGNGLCADRGIRLVAGLLLLVTAFVRPGTAGALTCSASVEPAQAAPGEVVVLTVTVEGEFGWSADFQVPPVAGADIASGGTSQSVSVANGITSASMSRTWYLTIVGSKDVRVDPITVSAGKEKCRTEPLTIKVSGQRNNTSLPPAVTGNRIQPQSAAPAQAGGPGRPGDDIFVTLTTDRDEVYVGQQVILTFGYYWGVRPWNNPTYTQPRTEGFWSERLGTDRNFSRVVDGRSYSVTEVRYALFPTRSGDMVIEPAELRFPQDMFDGFFNSSRRRRGPRVFRTNSVTVKVKELPEPRPEGFSGLVATDLDLRASISPDSVGTGDPLTLKATLIADGFLKGFAGLKVTAPEGVQIHDGTEDFHSEPARGRLASRMSLEKILVPKRAGELKLPALEVVWFDASADSYRTARSGFGSVTVAGEDLDVEGAPSGFLRTGLQRMGQDLAFIHPVPRHLRRAGSALVPGPVWWVLLVLPLVLLGGWKVTLGKLVAAGRDPFHRRRKQAWIQAQRLLAEAGETADPSAACTLLANAVRGFAADCLGLPAGQAGAVAVRDLAAGLGLAEVGDQLADILTSCDQVRFGGLDAERVPDLVSRTAGHLQSLEDRRRRTGSHRSATALLVAGLICGAGWCGLPMVVRAEAPPAVPVAEQLVAQGNQAFTAGDLTGAEDLYRQAVAQGVDDPVLYFNLGNAQARQGHLGEAVANYLRARRLAPRDKDIRRNLEFVRSSIRDLELSSGSLPLFISQLAGLVDLMTLAGWGVTVLVLIWVACLMTAWFLWRGRWRARQRRLLVSVGVALVLAAAATGWRWYQDVGRHQGVIVVEAASVRSGPASGFPVLFEVHDGLTVHLNGTQHDWVRISLGGDWTGWVPSAQIVAVNPQDAPQGR